MIAPTARRQPGAAAACACLCLLALLSGMPARGAAPDVQAQVPAPGASAGGSNLSRIGDRLSRGPVDVLVVLDDAPVAALLDRAVGPLQPGAFDRLRQDARAAVKDVLLARLAADDVQVRRRYPQLPMLALRLQSPAALARLVALGSVLEVAEDEPLAAHDASALAQVGQPAAAAAGQFGAGSTVVVIDSGLDYTRPEFGNCTAPGQPSGCRVLAAIDTAPEDGLRDDASLHGSRVAAAVLAAAPAATLVGIDAFSGATALASDIIEGIDWAIANRAAFNVVAINLSLGGSARFTAACGAGNPFRVPIQQAWQAGIATVASSGNAAWFDHDGNAATEPVFQQGIASPACVPLATSVGAAYDSAIGGVTYQYCADPSPAADQPACFSQVAPTLALLAPGASVDLLGTSSYGTSFAAPFVAGAFAVLRSARPAEGVDAALQRLLGAAAKVLDARTGTTFPRLQLADALGLPPNDAFSRATALDGGSGSFHGSNELATAEPGEPEHAGSSAARSLWWRWTAPTTGDATFSTVGSSFDTRLAVYAGASIAGLQPLAADDDSGGSGTSQLSFVASAGTVYSIAVDGKGGGRGNVTLSWKSTAWPVADMQLFLSPMPFAGVAGAASILSATVHNAGPAASAAALLSLSGPATALVQGIPGGCTSSAGSVGCAVPVLAAGASVVFEFTLASAAAATLEVTATLSGPVADPQASDNTASLVVAFSAPPDATVPLPGWALVLAGVGVLVAGIARQRR